MKMIIMAARGKIGPGIDEIVEKPELDEFTSRVDSGFTIGVVKGVIRDMMMVGEIFLDRHPIWLQGHPFSDFRKED
jgi:hypothetical protein